MTPLLFALETRTMMASTRRLRFFSNVALTLLAYQAAAAVAPSAGSILTGQEVGAPSEGVRSRTLVPLPILFRKPETGTGFGAALTVFFRLDAPPGRDSIAATSPSTLNAAAIHTTKGQTIVAVEPAVRLRGDRIRLSGVLELMRFPTTFWGIGNRTDERLEEGYTASAVNLEVRALLELRPGWYGGVGARFARRRISEVEPGGLVDRGAVPGTEDGRIVGVGLALTRDTRDRSVSPRSGSYHQLILGRFAGPLGSDFDYSEASVDLRRYLDLGGSSVLAVRALGASISGTAPFDVLPQLGGDELLRGYYGGRFRDKSLVAVQSELRCHVGWRLGAVGFGSVGQVAPSPSRLRVDGMKLAVGGGLRFALNKEEGLNLRADFGWGVSEGTRAFYLSLGEVF